MVLAIHCCAFGEAESWVSHRHEEGHAGRSWRSTGCKILRGNVENASRGIGIISATDLQCHLPAALTFGACLYELIAL